MERALGFTVDVMTDGPLPPPSRTRRGYRLYEPVLAERVGCGRRTRTTDKKEGL